eukprot:c21094_g1_i1 orf=107-1186(+)
MKIAQAIISLPVMAVALVASLSMQLIQRSPMDADVLVLPPLRSAEGPFASNSLLQRVERLGEGLVDGPEDIAVDERGIIYTATRDGWIKRMWPNGSWESWMHVGGRPLGLSIGAHGEILVCEPTMGLLNVTDGGITVLTSEADGSKFKLTDEAVIASDGMIYFTDASSKYGLDVWEYDILEARPHGRLLQYNPYTKKTNIILSDLAFANGVALSKEEDFLVVCETWKFRCLKHWLKGQLKGTTEIFINNLPGGPDNIHITDTGSFWVALLGLRSPIMDMVYRQRFLKHLVVLWPFLLKKFLPLRSEATVLKVGEDGQPIMSYKDPTGKQISFVTSAMQVGDFLYIGSLSANFVACLHLT